MKKNKHIVILATVYTPKETAVDVIKYDYNAEFSEEADKELTALYPNARKIYSGDNRYNCHSYAWYLASFISNRYWMPDPTAYISDGSYRAVSSSYATSAGQKVIWYRRYSDGTMYIEHSGIVHEYVSANNYTVISKWGSGQLMVHSLNYSPYECDEHYFYIAN